MVFRQRAQLARAKRRVRHANTIERDALDKHVRRFGDDAAQARRLLRRVDQGDAAAIGVADEKMVLPRQQCG